MVKPLLQGLRTALRTLNPEEVRAMAAQPLLFGVLAAADECVVGIHECLRRAPDSEGPQSLLRVACEEDFSRAALGFSERGIPHPQHFYSFDVRRPELAVRALLDENERYWLPLASGFPGLRSEVSDRLIWKVAKENVLFTVTTALPNIVPTALVLPWAVGEFASDTAFLTMNQVRLALLLAAVHGRDVGYNQQCVKIGSIIGSAFGWRALARELASKVPAGGGLASKGLIAFAGTYAVGRALDHWCREGLPLARAAQRQVYADACRRGKAVVEGLVRRALGSAGAAPEAA